MNRVDVAGAEGAYREWLADDRVFHFRFPDNGRALSGEPGPWDTLPTWDVDLPPAMFEHRETLRAWLTRPGRPPVRMSVWVNASGDLVTGLYPDKGDLVTIRW